MVKSHNILRRIRPITSNSENPQYGLGIPRHVADQFSGVQFRIFTTHNSIILESGCRLTNKKSMYLFKM